MIPIPPYRYILPNLFTLTSAFFGFAAIWLAAHDGSAAQFHLAATLICLAVFLDSLDGRVARWVDGQSKIGGQLDSFADFLTFGVAPSVLVYAWGLKSLGVFGLVISFVLATGAMLRLARFNVEAEETGGVSRYFTGLPAPAGGASVALLVGINTGYLGRHEMEAGAWPWVALVVVLVGLLMVSTVPFRTFKDVRNTWPNRLLFAAILAAVVIVSFRVDFMVALALLLVAYFSLTFAGGLLGAARHAQARSGRGSVDYGDDDYGDE